MADREHFTKKITSLAPSLSVVCEPTYAGDTREGEKGGNLAGDR